MKRTSKAALTAEESKILDSYLTIAKLADVAAAKATNEGYILLSASAVADAMQRYTQEKKAHNA